MIIQGKQVDSQNEYWIAQALDQYKMGYQYQYSLFGGDLRGGVILDFLIDGPRPIPVQVGKGGYWHAGNKGAADMLEAWRINQYGKKMGWDPLIELTLPETGDPLSALATVRQKLYA